MDSPWGRPAGAKPFGRYNWQTGKVESVGDDDDALYDEHVASAGGGGIGGGTPGGPPRMPGRPGPVPNTGKPWQHTVRKTVGALTSAQMRQAAFRGPHGLIQGIRYAAGLPPIDRHVLGMYRAEALENLALNPRQFQSNDSEEDE